MGKFKPNLSIAVPSSAAAETTSGIDQQLETLKIDDDQKKRLDEFIKQKQKVGVMENAQKSDFTKKGELGSGNGGVVHLVEHKASGILMARKLIHLEVKQAIQVSILVILMN